MDYKKLEELNKLRQSGALTDEEFESEKQKLMNEDASTVSAEKGTLPLGLSESAYLALMSFLILIPYAGWLVPIIAWIIGKDQSELINRQGKYILNWYISWFIFSIILAIILIISLIMGVGSITSFASMTNEDDISPALISTLFTSGGAGISAILLCIISLLSLLFPIIGGIKGLNNQTWKYPLSIPFLNTK